MEPGFRGRFYHPGVWSTVRASGRGDSTDVFGLDGNCCGAGGNSRQRFEAGLPCRISQVSGRLERRTAPIPRIIFELAEIAAGRRSASGFHRAGRAMPSASGGVDLSPVKSSAKRRRNVRHPAAGSPMPDSRERRVPGVRTSRPQVGRRPAARHGGRDARAPGFTAGAWFRPCRVGSILPLVNPVLSPIRPEADMKIRQRWSGRACGGGRPGAAGGRAGRSMNVAGLAPGRRGRAAGATMAG